jgi:hypothetical protein
MFSQKIAQVTSTDTDATLQNLNVKLDLLKEEYNAVASQPNTYSFFNLDNIYFWFVLAGLLLLAFGLLFLLAEIQNKSDKTKKNKKVVLEEEFEVEENDPNLEVAEQAVETLKDLGIDTTEVEAEIKEEIKKPKTAKKASWFKKEKKEKKNIKTVESKKNIETLEEEIIVPEVEKSKAKGPIKIKVEKIK